MTKLIKAQDHNGNNVYINIDNVKCLQNWNAGETIVEFGPEHKLYLVGDPADIFSEYFV